ncbi:lipase maturation factor family protein [Methylacidiphilum caldifontis]|uniref:lipase maturation factor family protein n=1 Tax=Methylacidiphilum caldifontis TaxID=2795386 RepID=UPI001A8D315A|nr:lipase maturation factor family protein [Methylacidiphilum caldifontis]QSR88387.1 lipase maturation factor family protein [Methylacidiphilum caldifontis]
MKISILHIQFKNIDNPLALWLFFRFLSFIYFIAFLSLSWQIHGLVGSEGILPAAQFLRFVHDQTGWERFFYVPTLFWFIPPTDIILKLGTILGLLFSVFLFFNIAPSVSSLCLWILYLSYVSIGQVFFNFQWDGLLLECGLLSILFSPWNLFCRLSTLTALPPWATFMFHWLLFKLMFLSGIVKLQSHDPTWRALTALKYHYETEPLPTPPAWFFYHFPMTFHEVSTFMVLFIELVVPFAIFLGKIGRRISFILFSFLQLFIIFTGNHAFFNWLSLALGLTLLDDDWIKKIFPFFLRLTPTCCPSIQKKFSPFLSLFVFLISALFFLESFLPPYPQDIKRILNFIASFRSINNYGAFAVMTTRRPEIIIEGSKDGIEWKEYPFRWKPDDPHKAPSFVSPFHPRMDWQMWFAALSTPRENPWFVSLLSCLLKGKKDVINLFKENPFPSSPPKYIRAHLYIYEYSSASEKKEKGLWWDRTYLGLYFPPSSLIPESTKKQTLEPHLPKRIKKFQRLFELPG